MKKSVFVPLLLLLLSFGYTPHLHAQLRVSSLRVEHCVNPSVVDVPQPRLSWVNNPKDERVRGQRQTAYQIVVASSEAKLRKGDYDLWDSGRVPSDVSVRYPTEARRSFPVRTATGWFGHGMPEGSAPNGASQGIGAWGC